MVSRTLTRSRRLPWRYNAATLVSRATGREGERLTSSPREPHRGYFISGFALDPRDRYFHRVAMQPVREFSARSLREIYRIIGRVASARLVSGATLISAWKHALINGGTALVGGFIRKSKAGTEYFCTNLEMKSPRGRVWACYSREANSWLRSAPPFR